MTYLFFGEHKICIFSTQKKQTCFFIQNLTEEHYAAVVSSIIAISQTLRLKVIAEGVETEQQLGILRKYGCHAMQGHYHSLPLMPEEVATLLQQGGRSPLPRVG